MTRRTRLTRFIDAQLSRLVAPLDRRRRGVGQKLTEIGRSKTRAQLRAYDRGSRFSSSVKHELNRKSFLMHSVVAFLAQRDPVRDFVTKLRVVRPRFDVMGVQSFATLAAIPTGAIVTSQYSVAPVPVSLRIAPTVISVGRACLKSVAAFCGTERNRSSLARLQSLRTFLSGFTELPPAMTAIDNASHSRVLPRSQPPAFARTISRYSSSRRIPRHCPSALFTSNSDFGFGGICAGTRAILSATSCNTTGPRHEQSPAFSTFPLHLGNGPSAYMRLRDAALGIPVAQLRAEFRVGSVRGDSECLSTLLTGKIKGHSGLLTRVWGVVPPAVASSAGAFHSPDFTIYKRKMVVSYA